MVTLSLKEKIIFLTEKMTRIISLSWCQLGPVKLCFVDCQRVCPLLEGIEGFGGIVVVLLEPRGHIYRST